MILVKVLIDSGNLCSDLISEKLAKDLNLKIDKSVQRNVGTACSNGKVKMIGTVKPMAVYLEGLKYPVIINPWVIKDLAHPINLGEKFLRRYNANLQFMSDCIRLRIKNQTVDLKTPSFNLAENSVDSRIKPVVDWYKFIGRNPIVSNQTTILDARKRKPLPGLDLREGKNEIFSVNTNISFPIYSKERKTVKAGTACPIKVEINNLKSHGHENFLFHPEKESIHVHNDLLFHPGLYNIEGEGITIANYSARDVSIENGILIGTANLIEKDDLQLNALSHKSQKELTKVELIERYNFIKDSLAIDTNEILNANPSYKEKVIDIFMRNFNSLAISEFDYGRTNLTEFEIKLLPEAKSVKMKARPLNPIQEKSLEKQIKAWLEAKVIEPANSPWSAALVPVRKKDTDEIRWCIDYRQLNAATVEDAYQLSRIDTSLQKLAGSKIFSILDSAGAFHTIPIEKESRPYTAFSSAFGQYQFLRMPFGIRNGVPAYSRLIDKALACLPQTYAMAYVDDLIVYSKCISEHLGHLEEIVKIHARAGMKIKLRKCKIFAKSVNYLGHKITEQGIQMIPKYVEKVLDWPLPKTGKELKSFLGFCGYYRSFIPNYSTLSADLDSLKMEENPVWTENLKTQFKNLKESFKTAPVRGYPDYESPEPFIVDTDYSGVAQAGVLSQVQGGKEKFLACVAKKNNEAERNYPSYKGELAAIIFTLRRFEHILRAKKFVVRTDSGPLQYLKTCKKTTGIFARFHNYLSTFNFDVVHRPGRNHVTADALSRREGLTEYKESSKRKLEPKAYLDGVEDNIYVSETLDYDNNAGTQISIDHPQPCVSLSKTYDFDICQNSGRERGTRRTTRLDTRTAVPYRDAGNPCNKENKLNLSNAEINKVYLNEQLNDSNLLQVRNWVEESNFPTDRKHLNKIQKIYFGFRQMLRICPQTRLLYILGDDKRICVPDAMVAELFRKFHVECGHPGLHETLRKLKRHFYFPNMQAYVNFRVVNCVDCLGKLTSEFGDRKAKPSHYSEEWLYFNQLLYIDLVGPLIPCRFKGKTVKYILTMQDGFTRFLAATPVEDASAEVAARALLESWCFLYGCPTHIKSDNGTNFTANVFRNVLKSLNIQQNFTPVYNPSSNRVERAHQTLMRYIRTSEDKNTSNWPNKLQMAVFWLNSSLNRITGMSPFKAVFGSEVILPLAYIVPKIPETVYKDFSSLINEKQLSMQSVHDYMIKNQAEYAKILDQNCNPEKYKLGLGDQVYYFTAICPEKGTKKLINYWTGPFLIHKIISDSVVQIKLINPTTERMKNRLISVNISRIRKIEPANDINEKYFFSVKAVPNQSYDENCLADSLDKKMDDELENAIILRNDANISAHSQNNTAEFKEGEKSVDIPLHTQETIDENPEPNLEQEVFDTPEMDKSQEKLEPRKAKLDALAKFGAKINEILSLILLD